MKTCKDEVIAVVEVRETSISIRRTKEYETKFVGLETFHEYKNKCKEPIVIVTESPHVEEFNVFGVNDLTTNKLVSSRPVNGTTGENIMSCLVTLLNNSMLSFPDGDYPVIVVNALQEQCSEGEDPKRHRTKNFIKLWESRKHFLVERLGSLEPCIVLSSCTVGDFFLENGESAYQSGERTSFEEHFRSLLNNDFNLSKSENSSTYTFLDSFDLSGLVLSAIHDTYGNRDMYIYKTSHPAAWSHRSPNLRKYNNIQYHYENITSCCT